MPSTVTKPTSEPRLSTPPVRSTPATPPIRANGSFALDFVRRRNDRDVGNVAQPQLSAGRCVDDELSQRGQITARFRGAPDDHFEFLLALVDFADFRAFHQRRRRAADEARGQAEAFGGFGAQPDFNLRDEDLRFDFQVDDAGHVGDGLLDFLAFGSQRREVGTIDADDDAGHRRAVEGGALGQQAMQSRDSDVVQPLERDAKYPQRLSAFLGNRDVRGSGTDQHDRATRSRDHGKLFDGDHARHGHVPRGLNLLENRIRLHGINARGQHVLALTNEFARDPHHLFGGLPWAENHLRHTLPQNPVVIHGRVTQVSER